MSNSGIVKIYLSRNINRNFQASQPLRFPCSAIVGSSRAWFLSRALGTPWRSLIGR